MKKILVDYEIQEERVAEIIQKVNNLEVIE